MSEEIPLAPLIHDGLDPAPQPKPTIAQLKDAVEGTVRGVGGTVEAARQPGIPLSILANIAREAPLGSLLIAFLLGIAVARRRTR